MIRSHDPPEDTRSVTETAADYESSDGEEPPPPAILADSSANTDDLQPRQSPKKRVKRGKPAIPTTPNIATSRQSKRTRKPNPQYCDDDIYDFYTNFKASNKRRRLNQSSGSDTTKAKETEESNDEETEPTTTNNESAKENDTSPTDTVTLSDSPVKKEPEPSPSLPSPRLPPSRPRPLPRANNNPTPPPSSSSAIYRPSYVPEASYLNTSTRVIMPRANVPRYRPPHAPHQTFQTIGGFQCTTPQTLASLPQYQDKRLRGVKEFAPFQCPDCPSVLKNYDSYCTHRNYAHGLIKRAKIVCPEAFCESRATNMNALVLHLRAHHGHALRYETFNFENQQEYDEWYRTLIYDGSVSFIRSSGIKEREKGSDSITLMFYCNKSARRDYHLRGVANSTKMQSACPAYFKMTKYQNGYITIYAQLTHVGHECKSKFKPIDSFPPIRDTLNDIEKNFKNLKALSRAKISSDYSLDNNSLVNSCLDILNNVAFDLNRAHNLLDGIVPDERAVDVTNHLFANETLTTFADDFETSPEHINDHSYSSSPMFSQDRDNEDEIQAFNESNRNSYPPTSMSTSAQPGSSRNQQLTNSGQTPRQNQLKMPMLLSNGRVQCTQCGVILKTFESYNVHRNTQHGLKPLNRSAMIQRHELPQDPAYDFDKRKLCSVCNLNFVNCDLHHILYCECCKVTFHRGCNNGHLAVCSSAPNTGL